MVKEKTSLICEKISLIKTLFFKIEAFFSLDVRKNNNKYYLSLKLFSINFSLRIEYLRQSMGESSLNLWPRLQLNFRLCDLNHSGKSYV